MTTTRQVRLAARPRGLPRPEDFTITDTKLPPLGDGELLCRTIWLSLDPYMRGRMDDAKSYAASVEVGGVMVGGTVCQVVESRNDRYAAGDFVQGMFGWQSHAISDGRGLRRLAPAEAPISTAVGVLGMPGLTAWVGLLDIGEPKPGETVVVSAASGAVGAVVGQIARIKGCRVVGVAGAPEKCAYVTDVLGFDACVSHRSPTLETDLAAACPDGIDVYFENVGGRTLDAVLGMVNPFARIPVCGLISQYNLAGTPEGPDKSTRMLRSILTNRLKIQGFIVTDRYERLQAFLGEMSAWVRAGDVKYREHVVDGLDNAPAGLIGLLQGQNFGKTLVRVSEDPTRNG